MPRKVFYLLCREFGCTTLVARSLPSVSPSPPSLFSHPTVISATAGIPPPSARFRQVQSCSHDQSHFSATSPRYRAAAIISRCNIPPIATIPHPTDTELQSRTSCSILPSTELKSWSTAQVQSCSHDPTHFAAAFS